MLIDGLPTVRYGSDAFEGGTLIFSQIAGIWRQ